jgi:hypothetical protein
MAFFAGNLPAGRREREACLSADRGGKYPVSLFCASSRPLPVLTALPAFVFPYRLPNLHFN